MGFTFSHPALILPVKYLPKKVYSFSGLVMGSMVPDFEYFIRPDNDSHLSHTFQGLYLFNIPLALALLFFFHQVIRPVFVNYLPELFKSRLIPYVEWDWIKYFRRNWWIVIISISFGVVTHLFWDSFTSINGYFVEKFVFLKSTTLIYNHPVFHYKIVKHFTSLLGVFILYWQFVRLPKYQGFDIQQNKPTYFWLLLSAFFIVAILYLFFPIKYPLTLNDLIKKGISCTLIAVMLTSLLYKSKFIFDHTFSRSRH